MNGDEGEGALEVLTILDLSQGVAGPYAAMLFARCGARVIKVEAPGRGDASRAQGPFFGEAGLETSSVFQAVNAGKLSLTLDYGGAEGADALRRLGEDADGIIEDDTTERPAALGLDTASLLARVPRLVIARVEGAAAGRPEQQLLAGLHVFAAALAALWRAAQTEHGQEVVIDAALCLASTPPPAADREPAALEYLQHPTAGSIGYAPAPFGLSRTPTTLERAPLLGEHTHHVLHDLIGWEAAAIEALRAGGMA